MLALAALTATLAVSAPTAPVTIDPDSGGAPTVRVDAGAALRTIGIFLHGRGPAPLPAGWQAAQETRLRPHATVSGRHATLGAAVELRSAARSAGAVADGGGGLLGDAAPLRLAPLRVRAVDSPAVTMDGWVDRLDAALAGGGFATVIGRQPLHLGTGHALAVLDVVAPFAPGDLESSFKPGVDAWRSRWAPGPRSELELIAVAADPLADGALIGRARASAGRVDVEVVGGRSRRRLFAGAGWEGEAGPLGLWGELAWFERRGEPWRGGWRRAAFVGVAGVEGQPLSDLWLGGGAGWQDFGARDSATLAMAAGDAPFAEGWRHLVGTAHGLATADWAFHPLWRADLLAIVNLVDGSVLAQPALRLSVADEADLTAFGWVAAGAAPTAGVLAVPRLRSEFGALPSGGGLYARWFF